MSPFGEAALQLAELGFAIFPLVPGEKRPLTTHGFKDATRDADQIRMWWTETPEANIGFPTGEANGVTVLDVDNKNGKNGTMTLLNLIAQHRDFTDTLWQKTPSGGLHYFYRYVPGLGNSAGKLGEGLDIRGDGGYVAVAPSMIAGVGEYKWENMLLLALGAAKLAEMSHWMKLALMSTVTHDGEVVGTLQRTGAEWAKKMKGVGKGGRQDELPKIVGKIIQQNFPNEEFARELAHAWYERCEPGDGFTLEAVDRCFDRIWAKEAAKQQRMLLAAPDVQTSEPETEEQDAGGLRNTDVANAKRLATRGAGQIAHADEMGEKFWLVYDGIRLVEESRVAVVPLVKEVAQELWAEVNKLREQEESLPRTTPEQEAEVERVQKLRAMKASIAARLEFKIGAFACIDMAQAEPALRIKVGDLDQHPTWLNCQNGTLDLESGEMHSHEFTDYLTKATAVPYQPQAQCPLWMKFLAEVLPDAEVRAFMQRAIGYALTDSMQEQCLWLLHGSGRNGKSTLLNVLRRVLGDYAATTHASTLLVKKHGDDKRNDLAALRGSRMVTVSEAEVGQALAEALLKQLTGGDPLTVRKLYAEYFTFDPTFKIFLAANTKPEVRGQDLAIWRRIHLVPFEVTVPLDRVDPDLVSRLVAEGAGILAWAVEGFRQWREGGLQVPQAVCEATEKYRREADPLADFLDLHTVKGPLERASAQELFETYQRWTQRVGIRFPMTQKALGAALQERGFKADRVGNERTRVWLGLAVRLNLS